MFQRSSCLRFLPRFSRAHLLGTAGVGLGFNAVASQWGNLYTNRRSFVATQRRLASDYYSTLGVSPTASAEEIKASYKRMALQYHPDRNKDPSAEEKFKTISEAYTIIGNKEKRAEYDTQRRFMGGGMGNGMGGGGTYSSQRPPYQSGKQTYQGAYPGKSSSGFQTMTTEEADKLFREIFGSMNMEQMLRDMEKRSRGGNTDKGNSTSDPFGNMGNMGQSYRPHFQSERDEVSFDANGNKTIKREFRDANGNVYNVYTTSSTDANASMNQSEEEVNEKYRDAAGRFRYGTNVSSGVGGGSYGNRYNADSGSPFGRVWSSNLSATGTNARLYLLVVTSILVLLAFGLLSFIIANPIMWFLLAALWLLRRRF